MTRVELKRLDEDFQVSIEQGETFLGRGPLLEITATNISRKHARLCVGENGDCQLTCLHKNPVFVLKSGDWTEVQKDETTKLEHENELKFLPDNFHYKILVTSKIDGSNNASQSSDTSTSHEKPDFVALKDAVISTEKVISPPPTGLRVIKKRKLPDWMQNSSAAKTPKKLPPDKTKPAQENKKLDIYSANVKLINSAWKSEEIIEPEAGKSEGYTDGGSGNDTPANIVKAEAGNNEVPVLKDDLTRPSSSKVPGRSPMKDLPQEKKEARGGSNVFPVLVAPEDLIDSDEDEQEKENFAQKLRVENRKDLRPSCSFGSSCYRKNPAHKLEEAHPGDDDYKDTSEEVSEDQEKPECEFGTKCYRKNPAHRKEYSHTRKPQPKRVAKVNANIHGEENSDSDDSFINDEEDGWEPVDDTDEDEDWAPTLSPDYI